MSAFGGLILTNKGRALQAKAQAGTQLNFTRMAAGDGELGGTSIQDLNALINEVKSLSITKVQTLSGGKALVRTFFSNQDVVTGFYFREFGVFAQDPDEGEILYCYGNAGANAEYIPAAGGADTIEKNIDVITIVGNAASVSATIDESLIFVTTQEFNDHLDDPDPHSQYALDVDLDNLAGPGRTTETVVGNRSLIGTLTNLITTAKDNLVNAINEILNSLNAHKAETTKHQSFLSLVQKHYKNISLAYSYITQNDEKLVNSISITGDITATINYTYNATTNALEQEQISVTAPFTATVTSSWTYDVDGDIDTESRVVS